MVEQLRGVLITGLVESERGLHSSKCTVVTWECWDYCFIRVGFNYFISWLDEICSTRSSRYSRTE